MPYKQNDRRFLSGADLFQVRRLNMLYLKVVDALKCRPEPRGRFDRVAAQRQASPGVEAAEDCRNALRAAVKTGDPSVINATRLAIIEYFAACCSTAVAEVPVEGMPTLSEAIKAYFRENMQAVEAVGVAAVERTDSANERAVTELREADDCGDALIAAMEAEFAIRGGKRHLSVSR